MPDPVYALHFSAEQMAIIYSEYNAGDSLTVLSKRHGVSLNILTKAVSEYTDEIISNFRKLPKAERLARNETQRQELEKSIIRQDPSKCTHPKTIREFNGGVYCTICERYLVKPNIKGI